MASILVIEDDPVFRSFLRHALGPCGHSVREARDGAEGLTLFQAQRPDLVLCDLFMPEKEGFETIQEIRRLDPAVRLVAMSARVSLLPVALALGAAATLSKPISPDVLLQCVDEVLAGPG
jgi:CheY-like chemotaxis protein